MSGYAWLVDTSTSRPSRMIAHRYAEGGLRGTCGRTARVPGRVFRVATKQDRVCADCVVKGAAIARREAGVAA